MTRFFLRIFDYFQRRRRLCMGLLAALTGVLILMVASLKYNENIFDFLPMSGDEQKAITLYQDISGGQRIIAMFGMKDGDATDADRLTEAVDTFAAKLQQNPGRKHIREVMTQVDFEKYAGVTDFIYQNIPLMLTDSDYVRMERLLASQGYAEDQLARDVEMVMMPATGFFATSIGNDPLALFSPVMDRLQGRQSSMPFEIDNGYVFTSGKRYAIALLSSPYGATESAENSRLVNYVDSVVRQTEQAMPDVDVAITGSPVIAVGNASQIKTDSQWAISIAVTLILLLLVFSFRRVKNLLLIGVSIVFGWLFAMGFIAALRSDVSLIVLAIGSIIIGIAVNYPLHFIAHTDHGGTAREVLKDMVAPLLIGNITTVGAFASLMPLDAPALRDLGLFAAFMLVGTILFVLIFLPHLVRKAAPSGKERLLFGKISSMSIDGHRWLLWVILALTVVFGYFSMRTSFDANMHSINYMTAEQEQLLANLHASAGINDTSNVYIVTEGDTWDEALKERTRIAPLLDSLKDKGLLKEYSDVTKFVNSTEEQQRRIDRWNDFWQKHREEVLLLLKQHAPQYGFSEDAFDGFKEIIARTYSTHPFEYFEPIRSVLLENSFSTSTGRCSVVDVMETDSKDIGQLETKLNEAVGTEGYAFDFVGMNSAMARSLSDNFNYIGFACGLIVFVFLWISFGRLELSLLAFLPMALGWIWILGIMYLFDMKFNIVNVILATFIFGQGDDYTIFMTDGLINEYAYRKKLLPSYKNSIVISALIMFIGMGSLIVAKHPALHSLAEVTIVGMLTVVLMAWIVPPLIFGWLVKTGGKIRREPITFMQIIRTGYCKMVGLTRGVKHTIKNEYDEDFSRGSVILCRQQSKIDSAFLRALSPRVLLPTNGKKELGQAIADGYNVVVSYEEAPRIAKQLNADILPVFIHGTSDVMPEGTSMLMSGQVNMEVGKRIPAERLSAYGETEDEIASHVSQSYKDHFEEMKHRIENTHYFHHYVISKYTYKGLGVERETRRLLNQYDDFSRWIDGYKPSADASQAVSVVNAGRGQFSLLFALVNPHLEVHSYAFDPDDAALAMGCDPMPANLHVHECRDLHEAREHAAGTHIIDLSEIIT